MTHGVLVHCNSGAVGRGLMGHFVPLGDGAGGRVALFAVVWGSESSHRNPSKWEFTEKAGMINQRRLPMSRDE